jgi:hypothetical protein
MAKIKRESQMILRLLIASKKTGEEHELALAVNSMEHAEEIMHFHKKRKKIKLLSASVTIIYYQE